MTTLKECAAIALKAAALCAGIFIAVKFIKWAWYL